MTVIQKKVFPVLLLLCVVLAMGACSPDSHPLIPTERIVIKNIPAEMFRTKDGYDNTKFPTFKVFVQLSNTQDPDTSSPGLGKATLTEGGKLEADGTYTVTIENLVDQDGNAWKTTNWAYESVIISRETVNDIFDIDIKVGMKGPSSSSSTVEFNWTSGLLGRITLLNMPNGIDNYIRIYDGKDKTIPKEGVIWLDYKEGEDSGNNINYIKGAVATPVDLRKEDFKAGSN